MGDLLRKLLPTSFELAFMGLVLVYLAAGLFGRALPAIGLFYVGVYVVLGLLFTLPSFGDGFWMTVLRILLLGLVVAPAVLLCGGLP